MSSFRIRGPQSEFYLLPHYSGLMDFKNRLEPGNLVLAVFAYAKTCTSHTKPPSKMHYIHFVYIHWLSTRVRNRNVSILFKTIENAAELTSTLTLNRHFRSCSRTTSGKMVLPVKTRNIIFCSHEPLLQVTQNRMSLSCLHMMIIGVMLPYRYLSLFPNIWASAMLRDHFR